jgi:hypothetical protein
MSSRARADFTFEPPPYCNTPISLKQAQNGLPLHIQQGSVIFNDSWCELFHGGQNVDDVWQLTDIAKYTIYVYAAIDMSNKSSKVTKVLIFIIIHISA